MRYTDPTRIRLKGDTKVAASYISEGRKYLGEVTEQLALGGIASGVGARVLTNAAGITFQVEVIALQPVLTITAPGGESGEKAYTISGFVTAPRTIASPTAFGLHPEFILDNNGGKLDPSENQAWASLDYAHYNKNPAGQKIYPDGLALSGSIDWRNQAETLAITWGTTHSRYFGTDNAMGDPTNAGGRIFHNGAILFNVMDMPDSGSVQRWIAGACLRGTSLIAVLFEQYFGGINQNTYAVVKLPLHKDPKVGPPEAKVPFVARFKKCDVAQITLLDRFLTSRYLIDFFAPVNFNQSGTEARGINIQFNSSYTTAFVKETIIDLRDLTAPTHSIVTHGTNQTYDTLQTQTYARTRPNLNFDNRLEFDYPPAALDNITVGSWTGTPRQERRLRHNWPLHEYNWGDTPGSTSREFIPLQSTTEITEIPSNDTYPCAVDYIDDVLTYAYGRTIKLHTASTLAATIDEAMNVTGTEHRTRAVAGDTVTTSDQALNTVRTGSATSAITTTINDRLVGIYVPNLAPLAGNWLDLHGSRTGTNVITASSSARANSMLTSAYDKNATPTNTSNYANPAAWDWASAFSNDKNSTKIDKKMTLWFLDLRFKAATYTETTRTDIIAHSVSRTSAFTIAPPYGNTVTETTVTSRTYTIKQAYDTKVMFYGEIKDSATGFLPDVVDTSGTGTYTSTWNVRNLGPEDIAGELGWYALTIEAESDDFGSGYWQGYANYEDFFAIILALPPWYINGGFVDLADFNTSLITGFVSQATITYSNPGATIYEDVAALDVPVFGGTVVLPYPGDVPLPYASPPALPGGTWIAYRKGWFFSMAWANGDVTTHQWHHGMDTATNTPTLNQLTGAHPGVGLYSRAWPLSQFTYTVKKGLPK